MSMTMFQDVIPSDITRFQLYNAMSNSTHAHKLVADNAEPVELLLKGVKFTISADGETECFIIVKNEEGEFSSYYTVAPSLINELTKIAPIFSDLIEGDGLTIVIRSISTKSNKSVYKVAVIEK